MPRTRKEPRLVAIRERHGGVEEDSTGILTLNTMKTRVNDMTARNTWRGLALSTLIAAGAASAAPVNDYPTVARADYVFACMAANGRTAEMLRRCSCSIDVIAELMPYEEYEKANTIMRIQRDQGQRGMLFRNAQWARDAVDVLKDAQAESTLRCF